jgi:hypothetical protein
MGPNCKSVHARANTVSRSVERQLQQSKEIVRSVDIGVFEGEYFSEWASFSPSFAIPKKNGASTIIVVTDFGKLNLLLKLRMSPIFYSKDWGHDSFNRRFYLCFSYYHIKVDADAQELSTIVFPWHMGKYKYKPLPMGIKIAIILIFSKCHVKACPRYGIC